MRIEKRLALCKTVLFSDDEYFNKDITGVKNLGDIKEWFCIKGRLTKCYEQGDKIGYRLGGSGYNFTLTFIL